MKKKMNAVEAQPIVQESRVEKVATQPVVATQSAMPAHPILKESGEQPGAGKLFGYIRVSSREQNEARQVVALHNFGITDDHIFLDKQSGKDFNRPAYQALLRQLNAGDVLVVKSIDLLPFPQWPLCRHDRQNPDRGSGPHRRGEDKMVSHDRPLSAFE